MALQRLSRVGTARSYAGLADRCNAACSRTCPCVRPGDERRRRV